MAELLISFHFPPTMCYGRRLVIRVMCEISTEPCEILQLLVLFFFFVLPYMDGKQFTVYCHVHIANTLQTVFFFYLLFYIKIKNKFI